MDICQIVVVIAQMALSGQPLSDAYVLLPSDRELVRTVYQMHEYKEFKDYVGHWRRTCETVQSARMAKKRRLQEISNGTSNQEPPKTKPER